MGPGNFVRVQGSTQNQVPGTSKGTPLRPKMAKHVPKHYIRWPKNIYSNYIGTTLRPKSILYGPYGHMEP